MNKPERPELFNSAQNLLKRVGDAGAKALRRAPSAALAEEMETPGEGQIRALLTFAGNPALSTPNSLSHSASLRVIGEP